MPSACWDIAPGRLEPNEQKALVVYLAAWWEIDGDTGSAIWRNTLRPATTLRDFAKQLGMVCRVIHTQPVHI
ncbi:hypothetical protein CFN58_29905 [Pseudomonas avellanae]|uniref:Uncharacterized protein n=2 Tax=Pseudomonas syringae group TaxID=136849 RepID=A0A261WCL5_9PSED|nr:hypothetical protein CT122_29045 [Pseudomonas syringae pv. actinidiae]OZI83672.1 hypothetical protein CFN58_29905 [Pseudomonas avellanae]PIN59024.1 hypothetical protein CUB86_24480 [Pseudomonas syringae pv. actinidiae]